MTYIADMPYTTTDRLTWNDANGALIVYRPGYTAKVLKDTTSSFQNLTITQHFTYSDSNSHWLDGFTYVDGGRRLWMSGNAVFWDKPGYHFEFTNVTYATPGWDEYIEHPAYDETITITPAWYEYINHPAWDEEVIITPAWDEEVIVTPAYDEEIVHPAYDDIIHHPAVTETVHHDAWSETIHHSGGSIFDFHIPLAVQNGMVVGKTSTNLEKTIWMDKYGDSHNDTVSDNIDIECYVDSSWLNVLTGDDDSYSALMMAIQSARTLFITGTAAISGMDMKEDLTCMKCTVKDIEKVETYSRYNTANRTPNMKITVEIYK